MKVDHYAVPHLPLHEDPDAPEAEAKGRLLAAIAQELDTGRRQSLERAAALMEQALDELQAYRDSAQYDYSRPKSMQFRGWNMGKLTQALRKTRAARSTASKP
jgi:hypothetical protein